MSYAVVVTFQIKPKDMESFMPLMRANARTSLLHETGCLQFDVATDPDRPGEVFLYEVYTGRAAFEDHLNSDHFLTFDAAAAALITEKDVRTYSEVEA